METVAVRPPVTDIGVLSPIFETPQPDGDLLSAPEVSVSVLDGLPTAVTSSASIVQEVMVFDSAVLQGPRDQEADEDQDALPEPETDPGYITNADPGDECDNPDCQ